MQARPSENAHAWRDCVRDIARECTARRRKMQSKCYTLMMMITAALEEIVEEALATAVPEGFLAQPALVNAQVCGNELELLCTDEGSIIMLWDQYQR